MNDRLYWKGHRVTFKLRLTQKSLTKFIFLLQLWNASHEVQFLTSYLRISAIITNFKLLFFKYTTLIGLLIS